MLEAYKKFWKGYVNFTGRSTRSDYWWVVLCNMIISAVLMMLGLLGQIQQISKIGESTGDVPVLTMIALVLAIIYLFAVLLPNLALIVRRLRDAGFPWPLIFLEFIPYLGDLVLFILNQFPTKDLG